MTTTLRGRARATIAAFVLAGVALNGLAALVLDAPELKDPEYGFRLTQLRNRESENPGRPLVLVTGSSRTALGVRPGEWEDSFPGQRDAPMLFNCSAIGGGPILELLVLRRAFADGIRPAIVLLEYWPPLFSGLPDDADAVSPNRLTTRDHLYIQGYADEAIEVAWVRRWCAPLYFARRQVLSQLLPRWVPSDNRAGDPWKDVDGWGWKPGCDFPPRPSTSRDTLVRQAHAAFAKRFEHFRIDEARDRAFRDAVAAARQAGARVELLYMPESSAFRSWYPPTAEREAHEHLARLTRELGAGVIDARDWLADVWFSDGFHLTRLGAAEFTRRLGREVEARLR